MILALVTFVFLLVLIAAKILTVLELRSLAYKHHRNQNRVLELEADLDTSRRKYLIALKSEGVAKNKTSQLKMRHKSAKQHLEQLQATAQQQQAQHQRERDAKLEALVMQALGMTSVRRDRQFKKVMNVISQLIDLDQHSNTQELMAAIQEKIAEMGKKGAAGAAKQEEGTAEEAVAAEPAPKPSSEPSAAAS